VRVSLKSVSGVDSVQVSLEKGVAFVTMKPGNTVTLKQLTHAITKNGFTMKDSTATVAGTVVSAEGKLKLRVSGSNDVLDLMPQSASTPGADPSLGKPVVVEGTIPEAGKANAANMIRYRSIVEEK
jgi:hypothetical protein